MAKQIAHQHQRSLDVFKRFFFVEYTFKNKNKSVRAQMRSGVLALNRLLNGIVSCSNSAHFSDIQRMEGWTDRLKDRSTYGRYGR